MSKSEPESASPTPLKDDEICVVLFNRWIKDTWHWTICIPSREINPDPMKYHATQPRGDPGRWIFESQPHSLATSLTACVVIRIGEFNYQTQIRSSLCSDPL